MIRLAICSAVLALLAACAAQQETTHRLFDERMVVSLPESYVLVELDEDPSTTEFVLRGGHAALAAKFPDHPYDPRFLERFLHEDMQALVKLKTVEMVPSDTDTWMGEDGRVHFPRGATAREVHERICKGFAAYYDASGTFGHFDAENEIGRCVNVAGSFEATFVRRIDNTLISAAAMDLVEFLIVEKKGPGKALHNMSAEEKWEVFKASANAKVAERALLSVRLP